MSGILDSKTRILDTIITSEGRRQLSHGGINIRYVSFTDSATFYAADIVSGSADATQRIFLEACNLPQDQITFQADDLGRLLPYETYDQSTLRGGQVITYTFDPIFKEKIGGALKQSETLIGDELNSNGERILSNAIENYKKQTAIGTIDNLFHDSEFAISANDIEFVISNDNPLKKEFQISDINHCQDIFIDPRFSHLPNFKYLPPINKVNDATIDKSDYRNVIDNQLGNYRSYGSANPKFKLNNIIREHSYYLQRGFARNLSFNPTSRANNLFIQAFEISNTTMYKLDIIDFGTFQSPPVESNIFATPDDVGPVGQVFFVGKLITKTGNSSHAFVHLFTLLFHSDK